MSATELFASLVQQGYDLDSDGDQLAVSGPPLTDDLRELIRDNKPAFCELANLKADAGPDWGWVAQDAKTLLAFAELMRTNRRKWLGQIPDHWTWETICQRCGPVPIWPGCPPKVSGCPWCFNRVRGDPMP
jgi:hypothetical protein